MKPGYSMQISAMDIIGPFPESRNGYILVVSDYSTWWVKAYAIPNQEAATVNFAVKLINSIILQYSIPVLF